MQKMRWFVLPVLGIVLTTWAAVALQKRRVDDGALKNAGKSGEWLTVGQNSFEQRYSTLKQIDATNVSRLGLA